MVMLLWVMLLLMIMLSTNDSIAIVIATNPSHLLHIVIFVIDEITIIIIITIIIMFQEVDMSVISVLCLHDVIVEIDEGNECEVHTHETSAAKPTQRAWLTSCL